MAMTKSRRASKTAKPFAVTGSALRHTPPLSTLATKEDLDGFIKARVQLFTEVTNVNHLVGDLVGEVGVLMVKADLLMEAAFERIAKLETALAQAKSVRRKSFDDLHVEQIDDRRVRMALTDGKDEAAFELKFPMMIDRGLWSDRATYERGDAITMNGGLWVAQMDNPSGRPGSPDSGWRLAVKAGRDAR